MTHSRKTPLLLAVVGTLAVVGAAFAAIDRPMSPSPLDPATPSPLSLPAEREGRWLLMPSEEAAIELEGRVAEVTADELRIERVGEPDAIVSLEPETSFLLEGRAVTRDQLPEGASVRATVIFDGQERVATRVEAQATREAPP